ncbi:hypothetical protein ERJ75_000781000 [Trypanosoma vivax]|nr:hypothetical protein ERJ75_000781000 [Trypanosoma vivax]
MPRAFTSLPLHLTTLVADSESHFQRTRLPGLLAPAPARQARPGIPKLSSRLCSAAVLQRVLGIVMHDRGRGCARREFPSPGVWVHGASTASPWRRGRIDASPGHREHAGTRTNMQSCPHCWACKRALRAKAWASCRRAARLLWALDTAKRGLHACTRLLGGTAPLFAKVALRQFAR